jgi:spoIIIJ-associated protein
MSEDARAGGGLVAEGEGETVGEARWAALHELERRFPGLARERVSYVVVSKGRRGMLGVGFEPVRVQATLAEAPPPSAPPAAAVEEPDSARLAREVVERVLEGLGIHAQADIDAGDDELLITVSGSDLGLLIGKHGQTIDSLQYLLNAILHRRDPHVPSVVLDAEGYRRRRARMLNDIALRTADQVRRSGLPQELDPMTAGERKVVHLCLKDVAGVRTESAGQEPNRHVVVLPADQV